MGKIIAVYGSPGSGKTSFALKLAQEIYMNRRIPKESGRIYFLSADTVTPSLAYLFPRRRSDELFSLGKLLETPDITPEDIYRYTVLPDGMKNFGILGYLAGEDRYSYASPDEYLIESLLETLSEMTDALMIDCSCRANDPVNICAGRAASYILQLSAGDVKSAAYYTSAPVRDGAIKVMNISDRELYLPLSDTDRYFDGGIDCVLPYSYELARQSVKGELVRPLTDKKYRQGLLDVLTHIYPELIPEKKRKGAVQDAHG